MSGGSPPGHDTADRAVSSDVLLVSVDMFFRMIPGVNFSRGAHRLTTEFRDVPPGALAFRGTYDSQASSDVHPGRPKFRSPPHRSVRHRDARTMLATIGYESLDALIDATVPDRIRLNPPLAIPQG